MIARITTGLAAILLTAFFAAAQEDAPLLPYGPLLQELTPQEKIVDPRTVSLIIQALQSETDIPRRAQLIADLGRCKTPESGAELKKLLRDREPILRAAVVRALAAIEQADENLLGKLLDDASPDVRIELIRARMPGAILNGLSDADPRVRQAAGAVSINEATDRALADHLAGFDPSLQAVACRTLGSRKYAGGAEAIARLLDSESIVTRVAAINALSSVGVIGRAQIEKQLDHAHFAVRAAATEAGMILRDDDRLSIANRSIADPDLAVRAGAAGLLGTLNREESVAPLLAQLGQGYEPLRLAARQALLAIAKGNARAQPLVISASAKLLSDSAADRRIDGSFLLGGLKSHEGFDAHVKLLADADWRVSWQAAISLGAIADIAAGPELVELAIRALNDTGEQASVEMNLARNWAGEQAILSAVLLKYRPVVERTKHVYLNKKFIGAPRDAAIYAMGVLGEPDQVWTALSPLLGRTGDMEESPTAIMEAVKAMGNARAKKSLETLAKLRGNLNFPEYGYVAHLSIDRINNTHTDFAQDSGRQVVETSIQALTPAAR